MLPSATLTTNGVLSPTQWCIVNSVMWTTSLGHQLHDHSKRNVDVPSSVCVCVCVCVYVCVYVCVCVCLCMYIYMYMYSCLALECSVHCYPSHTQHHTHNIDPRQHAIFNKSGGDGQHEYSVVDLGILKEGFQLCARFWKLINIH